MKTAFYIARRYLISKKSVNVINIISGISVAGVGVGTLALVVILSFFNGLEAGIKTLFSSFDPDIKITATIGKSFELKDGNFDAVRQLAEVESVTPVIEDDALLTYSDRQYFATIKGIPADYLTIAGMDSSFVTSGKFILESDGIPYAVVGMGVAYYLSVGLNFSEPIHVYAPKKGLKGQPNPANAFIHSTIYASGIFANQQEIDSKYVLVPFAFASELFKMEHKVSAVEVKLGEGAAEQKVRAKISDILGNKFVAKTQYEQHEVFYKVMQSEKWAIFLILGFILVIASFNILGSLSMLIIDKKADIAILESMGANRKLIRTIFLFEGWMISIIGAIIGLILGVVICWSQIEFGWLKIPNEGSFIFSSYPVEIRIGDLLSVFGLVTAIGFVAAWYPIRFISGNYLNPESK